MLRPYKSKFFFCVLCVLCGQSSESEQGPVTTGFYFALSVVKSYLRFACSGAPPLLRSRPFHFSRIGGAVDAAAINGDRLDHAKGALLAECVTALF